MGIVHMVGLPKGRRKSARPIFKQAQRPTKSLLTLGTHDYNDLCYAAHICVAITEATMADPQVYSI
jgi:hypothetical protein